MDLTVSQNHKQPVDNPTGENDNTGSYSLRRPASQNFLEENSRKRIRKENSQENQQYKNPHRRDRAFEEINSMRKRNLFCDVILEADGGSDVKAHKMILAACSPYFFAMFTSFGERDLPRVKLQGIDPSALELLVDYVYTTEVYITEENVQILLPAANLLQLTDVRDACCNFLRAQLHPSNCLGIRNFAEIHGCIELVAAANDCMEKHFSKVVEGDEFFTLTPQQVVKLISSDHLEVKSEEKVCECVISWVKADLKTRQDHLIELMKHVRLPLLSEKYLVQLVKKEPLIQGNSQCKDLVNKALEYHSLDDEGKKIFEASSTKLRGRVKVLLVVGGLTSSGITDRVEFYDFENEKWHLLSELTKKKCDAGLSVHDGRVYAIGGSDGSSRLRGVDVLDVCTGQWFSVADMKTCRSHHGVGVLGDLIYAVGGFDGAIISNSAEVYNPKTDKWRMISTMLSRRSAVGVGVVNDLLYAVGGFDNQLQNLSSVECYNPRKDEWMLTAQMSSPRVGAGVGVVNGILYVIGGSDGKSVLRSGESYNPKTSQWTAIANMALCRKHAGVVVFNELLYVVGGFDGHSKLDSVEVYSPKTNSWTNLPNSLTIGRSNSGVAIVDRPLK